MAPPLALPAAALAAALGTYLADQRLNVSGDVTRIYRLLSMVSFATKRAAAGRANAAFLLFENADAHPAKIALRSEDRREWTYPAVRASVLALASFLRADLALSPGSTVAVLMDTSPAMVFCYYACYASRTVMAGLNTHLVGPSLLHCVRACGAAVVIVEPAYVERVEAIRGELERDGVRIVLWDEGAEGSGPVVNERYLLARATDGGKAVLEDMGKTQLTDPAYVMFTSGTTGVPKANVRTHQNSIFFAAPGGLITFAAPKANDVVLGCLPLCHVTCWFAMTGALGQGATFVPVRKFSATKFWQQAADLGATVFYYVGEMARYLAAQPPSDHEKRHRVRTVVGNGLRRDLFPLFPTRFGIPRVVEMYGASDGTSFLLNDWTAGSPGEGSVGRAGPLLRRMMGGPVLLKVDAASGEVVRGEDGLCRAAGPGEPGECWVEGAVNYRNDPTSVEKKILRDVFKKGDAFWRMGDLLSRDSAGRYYFVDRLGDTFRWKSENVSTFEVATSLGEHPAVEDATVYGVKVPGAAGRAGMAIVVLKEAYRGLPREETEKLMRELGKFALERIPRYATPVFVRLQGEIELTVSLKHRKLEYQNEGYSTADWWMPPGSDEYVPFREEDMVKIDVGKARL
ncbi:hypothetical protein DFJ74DRAFT_759776 [Hyaloraphidium curvatum]|nr:hypothetical protein DFJ74DRAFT_759776 [Hyaloraphidium curvatum]